VVGCCECSDEPLGSCAMELVSKKTFYLQVQFTFLPPVKSLAGCFYFAIWCCCNSTEVLLFRLPVLYNTFKNFKILNKTALVFESLLFRLWIYGVLLRMKLLFISSAIHSLVCL
jgi:hypothetical protein